MSSSVLPRSSTDPTTSTASNTFSKALYVTPVGFRPGSQQRLPVLSRLKRGSANRGHSTRTRRAMHAPPRQCDPISSHRAPATHPPDRPRARLRRRSHHSQQRPSRRCCCCSHCAADPAAAAWRCWMQSWLGCCSRWRRRPRRQPLYPGLGCTGAAARAERAGALLLVAAGRSWWWWAAWGRGSWGGVGKEVGSRGAPIGLDQRPVYVSGPGATCLDAVHNALNSRPYPAALWLLQQAQRLVPTRGRSIAAAAAAALRRDWPRAHAPSVSGRGRSRWRARAAARLPTWAPWPQGARGARLG